MKLGKVPILDWVNKVPGGLMVVPLFLGVLVNTFFPEVLNIGSFTTGLFKTGTSALIGFTFFCSGSQIRFKTAGVTLYKGLVINFGKVATGVAFGVIFAKLAGPDAALLGVTPLAMISAMSNSNGGLFAALSARYGTSSDVGALAVLATNDGPFFEMMFMGVAGVANIPIMTLVACLVPLVVGMVLGNLDDKIADFLKPGVMLSIPFFSFPLGAAMDLKTLISAGFPGILLGVITVVVTGLPTYFLYRLLIPKSQRHSCVPGMAIGTAAGNCVATPLAIANADPTWAPYVPVAAAQCAAAVIVTALLVPLFVDFLYKREQKKGQLNMDLLPDGLSAIDAD